MIEKHILAEARNIARNHPVHPGDTISHATAKEVRKRGWSMRDENGDWLPTESCPFQIVKG